MEGNAAYLDFDLRFTRSDGGFRAEILRSPGGVAERVFQLPWGEHELENYLLKIGQRRSGMRKADSPENRAAREFGDKLFQTVFADEVQTAFRKSVEKARAGGNGLRLRLYLDEAPELADLPWEYLYQPQRREFLALSTETPIVRYFELPETVKPLAVTPPLRVLVMLSNPSDVDCLDVEKEWQKLKEAVGYLEERGLLIAERLEHATLSALQNRLRKEQYHVFHFIGHGSFDPSTQESVLALEDEDGRKRLVSGPDLGIYLRDEPALRLVLLNACEGGRASRTDPFSGAAQSLVLKGIPAVIAMQFEVSDEAAIAMASGFYAALADDYPVDAALTEARKAVFAAGCTVEWGTPVLYLRAPDGRIFDVNKTEAQKAEPALRPAVPPPLPPVDTRPEPVVRPEPKPEPVVPRQPEVVPRRGGRPILWLLIGMVLMFVLFISFGIWLSNKRKQDAERLALESPTPAATATVEPTVSSFTPPPVDSKYQPEATVPANSAILPLVKGTADIGTLPLVEGSATPANPEDIKALKQDIEALGKMQKDSSATLDKMDAAARQAIAGIRTDDTPPANISKRPLVTATATPAHDDDELDTNEPTNSYSGSGAPAGNDFNPTGWWKVKIDPGIQSRFNFQAGGVLTATGEGAARSQQATGLWSYVPDTSTLGVVFENGSWAWVPLKKSGSGFTGFYFENGARRDIYIEKEPAQKQAAPNKKKVLGHGRVRGS